MTTTPERPTCPHCKAVLKYVRLDDHLDRCPVLIYRVGGYDPPHVQAFSDHIRRAGQREGEAP